MLRAISHPSKRKPQYFSGALSELSNNVTKNNGSPIYQKLRDDIAEQINSGLLGAGERLPSERDMAAKMGAARETIRVALSLLEGEGIIFRKSGSGYFVSRARWRYDPTNHVNQYQIIQELGSKPGNIDLNRSATSASSSIAELMGCVEGTQLVVLTGVGLQDGRKICFEESYLLESAFPGFLDAEFESPLTDFLVNQYNTRVEQIGFRARYTNLMGAVAKSLGVRVGTPGLFITRIKAKDGVTIWVDYEYWLADVLEISIGSFPYNS